MRRWLLAALGFLPAVLGAQTAPTKAARSQPVLQQGQVGLFWVDTSGHLHIKCDSGCTSAGGGGDSLRVIAWLDSLRHGFLDSVGLVKRSRDSLVAGYNHAGRVAIDSILAGQTHVGRVAVDSILASQSHVGRVAVDSILASQTHIGRTTVDSILANQTHVGRVTVDSQLANQTHVGRVAVDSILANQTHIGRVTVDSTLWLVRDTSVSGTLGAANATVTLTVVGRQNVGIAVIGSQSCTETLVIEHSTDNQTNWDSRIFWNGDAFVTGDVLPNGNGITKRAYSIAMGATDTDVRIRVLTYTSGSCTGIIRAGNVMERQGIQALGLGIDQGILGAGGGLWDAESPISISIGGGDETSPTRQHRTPHVVAGTPAEADYGFVVRPLNQNRVVGPTALSALNAAIQVSTQGQSGVGLWVGASTLVGTLVVENSADGGTTWSNSSLLDEAGLAWLTAGIVNPAASKSYTVLLPSDGRLVRARVSAFTSGSVTPTIVTSQVINPLALLPTISIDGVNSPIFTGAVSGTDAAGVSRTLRVTPKGTQGTNGLATQDLKDAGRQQIMLSWEEMAGTAGAESALTNFTLGSKNATALSAATSYTVSTGKTLRIQSVTIYLKSTSTAELLARYRIRQAATVANSSPVIWDGVMALDAATVAATQGDQLAIPIPDGLEVAAGQQITFTWFTSANTSTVGMSITGYEY